MVDIGTRGVLTRALCALFIVTAFPPVSGAKAKDEVVLPFAAPEGFALTPVTLDSEGQLALYSATSPAANWNIAQWANPGDGSGLLLPGFTFNTKEQRGILASWTSAMPDGGSSVTVALNRDGTWSETLSQDGNACPNNQADEYDLFVQNNSKSLEPDWPSAYYWDNNPGTPVPLNQVSSLKVSGTLTVSKFSVTNPQSPCSVNQAAGGFSLIFSNSVANPPQTLFYQIALTNFCLPNAPWWCGGDGTAYFEGGDTPVFGIGDNSLLASYGQRPIADNDPHQLELNILPVITRLIQEGSTGRVDRKRSWHQPFRGLSPGYEYQPLDARRHLLRSTAVGQYRDDQHLEGFRPGDDLKKVVYRACGLPGRSEHPRKCKWWT